MGFLTAATIAGVGLSAFGTVKQMDAAKDQSRAQQEQIAAEQKAEALRRQQMELEGRRRQREIIRNQQRARAVALATTNNQGASQGSGLPGAYGQIAGDAGTQQVNTNQNLLIGRGIFDANLEVSAARRSYAEASTDMATGKGYSALGSNVMAIGQYLNPIMQGYNPNRGGGNSYGGWYDLSRSGAHPFPMPYQRQ